MAYLDYKEKQGQRDHQDLKVPKETLDQLVFLVNVEKQDHKASRVSRVQMGLKEALGHREHQAQLDHQENLEKLACQAIRVQKAQRVLKGTLD